MSAQIVQLPWHTPKIIELGIRVPMRKNTLSNFLKTIKQCVTVHKQFPIVYPEVKIVSKKTVDGRLRSRAARQRIKENLRRDPVRFHNLPLHDSAVIAILCDVEIEQAHNLNYE